MRNRSCVDHNASNVDDSWSRRLFLETLLRSTWTNEADIVCIVDFVMDAGDDDGDDDDNSTAQACSVPIGDLIVRLLTDVANVKPIAILIDNAQFLSSTATVVLQALVDRQIRGPSFGSV